MSPLALHHLAVKARDVERVAAFYRDALGLPELRRHQDPSGLRAIWLDAAGVILMVERAGAPGAPQDGDPPGLHLVAFQIPAQAHPEWRARLDAAGVEITSTSDYTLYLRDPEGNRVGLSSYPERGAS
ncbi:MAG: VOC family protein [Deltaproteobacteria bacterium]|nr:VOC family protein [Deltaproteobacteria bacterium]